jgi:(2Fe-2S) ferredoxin
LVPSTVIDTMAARGVRTLLIRRPGRRTRRRTEAGWSAIFGLAGGPMKRVRVDTLDALSTVDGGSDVVAPMLLVCTHSARDRCCATRGRPIARELASAYPDQVWESSHLGGHRFAGNLLSVPDGYLYGRLDVDSARAVADAALAGRVVPEHLRGRTTLGPAEQAAEVAVRRASGVDGVDAVRVLSRQDGTITVDAAGREFRARVSWSTSGTPLLTSCGDSFAPSGWVVSVEAEGPAPEARVGEGPSRL